jgi:hypothetical protein
MDFENNFVLLKTLEFNNEVFANVNFHSYHFDQNEKFTLMTFKKDNKIIVYNLKSEMVEYEINLNKLESQIYRDHLFHNPDSIFICSILNNREMFLLLMNSNGEIYQRWNINKLANKETNGYFYIDSGPSHPMELINGKLYFLASYKLKPGSILKSPVSIEMGLDLSSGIANQIGDLPSEFKQGLFYGNHQKDYSRVINKRNELVFSFPISNYIYVYDLIGELLKIINCRSQFINDLEPIEKNRYTDLSAIIDAYAYNAQYGDLVYDEYNNMYYRVVLHKLEKFDDQGKKNDHKKRNWSIMILDENLKVIKEVLMPEEKFWKRILITDQGIILKSISMNTSDEYQIYKFQPCLN